MRAGRIKSISHQDSVMSMVCDKLGAKQGYCNQMLKLDAVDQILKNFHLIGVNVTFPIRIKHRL